MTAPHNAQRCHAESGALRGLANDARVLGSFKIGYVDFLVDGVALRVPDGDRRVPDTPRRSYWTTVIPQLFSNTSPVGPDAEQRGLAEATRLQGELLRLFPCASPREIRYAPGATAVGARGELYQMLEIAVDNVSTCPTEKDFDAFMDEYPEWKQLRHTREQMYPRGVEVPSRHRSSPFFSIDAAAFYRAVELRWGDESLGGGYGVSERLEQFVNAVEEARRIHPDIRPWLMVGERHKLLDPVRAVVARPACNLSDDGLWVAQQRQVAGQEDKPIWHQPMKSAKDVAEFVELAKMLEAKSGLLEFLEIGPLGQVELMAEHERRQRLKAGENPAHDPARLRSAGIGLSLAAAVAAMFAGIQVSNMLSDGLNGADGRFMTPVFAFAALSLGLDQTVKRLQRGHAIMSGRLQAALLEASDPFRLLDAIRARMLLFRKSDRAWRDLERHGTTLREFSDSGANGVVVNPANPAAVYQVARRRFVEAELNRTASRRNDRAKEDALRLLGRSRTTSTGATEAFDLEYLLRNSATAEAVKDIQLLPGQIADLKSHETRLRSRGTGREELEVAIRLKRAKYQAANRAAVLEFILRWEKPEPLQLVLDPRIPANTLEALLGAYLIQRHNSKLFSRYATAFSKRRADDPDEFSGGLKGFIEGFRRKGEASEYSFHVPYRSLCDANNAAEHACVSWCDIPGPWQHKRMVVVREEASRVQECVNLLSYSEDWKLQLARNGSRALTALSGGALGLSHLF